MGPVIIITSLAFSLYINLASAQHMNCSEDLLFLNFSNVDILSIGRNFVSSPLIKYLNLADNGLREVNEGAFDNVPNLIYLNMSNNYIEESFSFGSHPKIETLDLSNQKINGQSITLCSHFPQLRYLYLQKNVINRIDFKCLSNEKMSLFQKRTLFPKLKYLDLSSSRISEMVDTTWFLVDSLTHLYLHNNNIRSLYLGVLSNLTDLTLDNNYMSDVYPTIVGLRNLKYLSISHNRLTDINFSDLENLTFLNLSFNELSTVNIKAFQDLVQLETLDLSHNRIKNADFLKNLPKLKTLLLSCNRIFDLPPYAFTSTPSLSKLYLQNNQISKVAWTAFENVTNLEELHLDNNVLTSLPPGWSETMINLYYLNLGNNRFQFLELLSLSDNIPLLDLYLYNNPLKHMQRESFHDLPANVTVHLAPAPEAPLHICTEDDLPYLY